ncbi:MAG: transcriptional repressor [Muribaculaceae bacterium]|nr:transcriptional repressor [Muribaculaceae bacterium]
MKNEDLLEQAGVRPSPVRILLLRCLREAVGPLSIQELEQRMETVDRSSISRTLAIFASHHLIHSIDDGSGACKFEICHAPECHSGNGLNGSQQTDYGDLHPHFHCEGCHTTYCLDSLTIPALPLPDGFRPYTANYVIKGFCPRCADGAQDAPA